MTVIKLCGLSRACDIEVANKLKPQYIGFVFYGKSKRYVSPTKAKELRSLLLPDIKVVGVFVNEEIDNILSLVNNEIIDIIQLHGSENEEYINKLKKITTTPVIKAFSIKNEEDVKNAEKSNAHYILLDSGKGGTGEVFNWQLLKNIKRDYFLAGGLDSDNVATAIKALKPFGVDVSSGIETNGYKDKEKMAKFVANAEGRLK